MTDATADAATPEPGVRPTPTADRRSARRAALVGSLGTLIEYYDFSVYAFLAVVFAPLFFPAGSAAVSLLSALAVFGSAYVVRPLGGLFFGRLGDRSGRRTALVGTVVLMGLASVLIGILPTYATAGVLAPVLLVLLRLLQGFSAGGELMGSVTFVAESTPRGRRGLAASVTPLGSALGFATAAAVVGAVSALVGPENMVEWGWRIPFLLCLPLTVACLLVRLRVEDSPEFRAMQAASEVHSRPVAEAVRRHWPTVALVAALAFGLTAVSYVGQAYMNVFLVQTVGLDRGTVAWLSAAVIAIAALASMPLSGLLSDRWGRYPVFLVATGAVVVLAYPLFVLMASTSNVVAIGLWYTVYLLLSGAQTVAAFALLPDLFPRSVRYSGGALGHNLGVIVGGGFTPYLCAQLVVLTGDPLSPAYWAAAGGVAGIVAVTLVRRRGLAATPDAQEGLAG